MMCNEVRLNISRETYQTKEESKSCLTSYGAKSVKREKMAFQEVSLSIEELLCRAVEGYAFAGLFDYKEGEKYWFRGTNGHAYKDEAFYRRGANKGYMKTQCLCSEHFRGGQVVFVDIDETILSTIWEYVDHLTYHPTLAYCTYSDRLEKNGVVSRRFRLIYVFSEILPPSEWKRAARILAAQASRDTGEDVDNCSTVEAQYFNGTKNRYETYQEDVIYTLKDLKFSRELLKDYDDLIADTKGNEKKELNLDIFEDKYLIHDMKLCSDTEYKHYHCAKYPYITHTTYTDFNEDGYTITDNNYHSLMYNTKPVRDGQHRRKKLLYRAAQRRLIDTSITPDILLHNMYMDRSAFIDNSDGLVSVDWMVGAVSSVMGYTIEEMQEQFKEVEIRKPKFQVDPSLGKEEKRKVVALARRQMTDQKISELDNPNLSVKENLEVFHKNGVKVGKSRYYEWIKKHRPR